MFPKIEVIARIYRKISRQSDYFTPEFHFKATDTPIPTKLYLLPFLSLSFLFYFFLNFWLLHIFYYMKQISIDEIIRRRRHSKL